MSVYSKSHYVTLALHKAHLVVVVLTAIPHWSSLMLSYCLSPALNGRLHTPLSLTSFDWQITHPIVSHEPWLADYTPHCLSPALIGRLHTPLSLTSLIGRLHSPLSLTSFDWQITHPIVSHQFDWQITHPIVPHEFDWQITHPIVSHQFDWQITHHNITQALLSYSSIVATITKKGNILAVTIMTASWKVANFTNIDNILLLLLFHFLLLHLILFLSLS